MGRKRVDGHARIPPAMARICMAMEIAQLLTELCKVEGICWIRVLYCYPERITDELLEVMAKEDKILKYMDLPLQHCNRQVLRAMNRRATGNRCRL